MKASSVITLILLSGISSAQYPRIYPNVTEDGTKHLNFGFMHRILYLLNSRRIDLSAVYVPGVEVALDQINSDPTMLPGYTLHYTLVDSQCLRRKALDEFHRLILKLTAQTQIAWLGSGCSPATEPTAEVSHYYNITQISCSSSSPSLRNRESLRYYFQMLPTDDLLAHGFFAIIKQYGWRRVDIIQQDEKLFTVTMDTLKTLLDGIEVKYTQRTFATSARVTALGSEILDDSARIFILAMEQEFARDVLCEAYRCGFRYPTHFFLTLMYPWYEVKEWWLVPDPRHNCTPEQRNSVVPYIMGPVDYDLITDHSVVADTGFNGSQYNQSFFQRVGNAPLDVSSEVIGSGRASHCYDGTWAMAYALNETLTDLLTNGTLRRMAGIEAELEDSDGFGLENFTYKNEIIAKTMFRHLEATDFVGLTGRVSFDSDGIRRESRTTVRQLRPNANLQQLDLVDVADWIRDGNNTQFQYIAPWSDDNLWPNGLVPYDGVPIEEIETVAVPLTVIYTLLATAGIIFAIVCLVFNFVFRQRKLIKLTSPNLNYLTAVGAIVLYIEVYLTVVQTESQDTVSVLCNVTPWLTSLGYSLCFGAILAKMIRVVYIFNNPSGAKKNILTDLRLALVVLALVMVDLVILVVYTIVEGAMGDLKAERVENKENTSDTVGEQNTIYEYYFYTCSSRSRNITLAILYGYKGVLQAVSLLFAFQTRKVKIKGLNDAKYIAGAVYVTSLMLVIIMVSTFLLEKYYINFYPALFSLGLLVGATSILLLVFVPKMVSLYSDPHGENIFSGTTGTERVQPRPAPEVNKSNGELTLETAKELIETLRRRTKELESREPLPSTQV